MIDHVAIQAKDVNAAVTFYLEVFAALGFSEAMRFDLGDGPVVGIGGPDGFPHFWIGPEVEPDRREIHLAFTAPDRSAVDAVEAAAVAAGAQLLHPAREWPEYHQGYYGVFVRDLDGNNVEAVSHR
ncbi:VOC family protein [Nakamurella silvestris]|nr:VOC family protein [Nakamurella silvestris]